jgi:KipI family sensor histidine kinase inhibitor
VGDSALSVEFAASHSLEANLRVRALDSRLREEAPRGYRESVPTLRSLLVLYDGAGERFASFRDRVLGMLGEAALPPGRVHEIPTLYGGEGGPDLGDLARAKGLPESEVVRRHSEREYEALMVGFTPGFAYLGPLDPALETKRRASPRIRVRAGSVGIAGGLTGIYPVASPGGWTLIGLTRVRLFDPLSAEPARIRPGDRVRFLPVDELGPAPEAPALPRSGGAALVEVLEGGLLTTVQDLGRSGFRRVGVAGAGPVDSAAHRTANDAVGNPEDAPALEITFLGPGLRFLRSVRFALAGADLGPILVRNDLGRWPCPRGVAVQAREGNVLTFQGGSGGARTYLAFAGGICVPRILGSCSTDLTGGFGGFSGRALRAGDVLHGGAPSEGTRPRSRPPEAAAPRTVRVVLGPQDDHFDRNSLRRFLSEPFSLTKECDRVGLRLKGPPLPHSMEIASDGMVPGSVQVPPSGDPIVMLADAPTTGGYPKIATVIGPDLPLLAQLLPGEGQVRFEAVSVEEAQALLFEGS